MNISTMQTMSLATILLPLLGPIVSGFQPDLLCTLTIYVLYYSVLGISLGFSLQAINIIFGYNMIKVHWALGLLGLAGAALATSNTGNFTTDHIASLAGSYTSVSIILQKLDAILNIVKDANGAIASIPGVISAFVSSYTTFHVYAAYCPWPTYFGYVFCAYSQILANLSLAAAGVGSVQLMSSWLPNNVIGFWSLLTSVVLSVPLATLMHFGFNRVIEHLINIPGLNALPI